MLFPLSKMSKWWTTLADGPRFLGPFYLQVVPSLGWSSFVPMGDDFTIQGYSWYQLISVDIQLKTMNQLRQRSRLQTPWALYKADMTASPGFLCGSPVTTDCSCCPCDMSLGHPPWEISLELQLENNRNAHVPWSKHCFFKVILPIKGW